MIRRIIKIDQDKCNGCGLCVSACHEGAIKMVNGKANLIRDDYCDGLGDCLPNCPTGAISFENREAKAYDREAVEKNMKMKNKKISSCPGSMSKSIIRNPVKVEREEPLQSMLSQWPVQIKLAPVNAPYFEDAKLLIAADCTAYAYANFHMEFIKDHITLIGCPKLDNIDYSEKLTEIIKNNSIKSVTVVKMEVPCCTGLKNAVVSALKNSGKMIPWQVVTVTTDGKLIKDM